MKSVAAFLVLFSVAAQDKPEEISKKDLPKAAECTVCTMTGEAHGKEKPAGGLMYKGKAYYFCANKELALFKKDPEAYIPLPLPRSMHEFSMTDTNGTLWDEARMKGKVVLIDFWATWCGPCKAMFPIYDRLYARYKERGFELLSVSVDEKQKNFEQFLKGHKFPNPVLYDSANIFAKWGVRNIPAAFLVQDGVIIGQWVGKQTEATFEAAIQAALPKAVIAPHRNVER